MSTGTLAPVPAAWKALADRYRELSAAGPAFLRELRHAGWTFFAEGGLPGRREEDWREIDLRPLAELPLVPAAERATRVPPAVLDRPEVTGPAPPRLVLAGGRLREDLSAADPLPGGIEVLPLPEASRRVPDLLAAHLGRLAPAENPFVALNTALLEEGLLVRVTAGTDVDVPLHLVHVAPPAESPLACHPRVLLLAEAGARVTVIESFLGPGEARGLVNGVTELLVGPGARVTHARVQHGAPGVHHVAHVGARVESGGTLHSLSIALGGPLVRVGIDARLAGEGAEAVLDGLFLAGAGHVVDHHTSIHHEVPRCTSEQLYKGVLAGDGRGVFRGRIVVAPGAEQSAARQQNRNLLLSPAALVRSRPQLEIYADDVRATHGATVGQLDEDMLFYFRSRGIGPAEARHLLLAAFTGEILERLPGPSLPSLLAGRVGEFLAGVPGREAEER